MSRSLVSSSTPGSIWLGGLLFLIWGLLLLIDGESLMNGQKPYKITPVTVIYVKYCHQLA